MNFLKKIALLVTIAALSASAENRFCIGGDLQHLSSAEKSSCQAKLNQLRTSVAQNSSVDNWHFVVVCNEAGWTDYAAFSGKPADELAVLSVDTDMTERSSYFRGGRLAGNEATSHLISTELAAIDAPATGLQIASRQ